jgi:hypothetical protein
MSGRRRLPEPPPRRDPRFDSKRATAFDRASHCPVQQPRLQHDDDPPRPDGRGDQDPLQQLVALLGVRQEYRASSSLS